MTCRGKVALVTGATGPGLGRSIALTLAREGARVVVNYRASDERAQAVVQRIEDDGGCAVAIAADVADPDRCRELVRAALDRFGQVDICVVGPGGGWHPEPVDQLAAQDALSDLQHEAAPVLQLLPEVLPGMYERGWGRIVGIASHLTLRSPAYAYNLGKAARTQALLLAAEQAWEHGVTVNVVAPGPITGWEALDDAADHVRHGTGWDERVQVTPQDVAEGVAFLCSESGRFVTGCVLPYLFH